MHVKTLAAGSSLWTDLQLLTQKMGQTSKSAELWWLLYLDLLSKGYRSIPFERFNCALQLRSGLQQTQSVEEWQQASREQDMPGSCPSPPACSALYVPSFKYLTQHTHHIESVHLYKPALASQKHSCTYVLANTVLFRLVSTKLLEGEFTLVPTPKNFKSTDSKEAGKTLLTKEKKRNRAAGPLTPGVCHTKRGR